MSSLYSIRNAAQNPQEISKVLLPWPGLRNTLERYASNRNPETNGVAVELSCFPRETETFVFYYVFGGTSVSAQLGCKCQQTLVSCSMSRQSYHSIVSRRFVLKKIRTEIDSFAKRSDVINILTIHIQKLQHNTREQIFSLL